MKSIVIGAGIGQLYKSVLTELGHQVIIVDTDPDKSPNYTNLSQALEEHTFFDTAHICTPNFTHYPLASQLARHSQIVFIEKPGVSSEQQWNSLVHRYPRTRFMMVKNNQWRDNLSEIKRLAATSTIIKLHWINKNRVPNPGSWFTDKKLAFGGVSRDLLPHLLSLFIAIEPNYHSAIWTSANKNQRWRLQDLTGTDYGSINPQGIYDVDDRAEMHALVDGKNYSIIADWRSDDQDDIAIYLDDVRIPLGLCPESAYQSMIANAVFNLDDEAFWQNQYRQDYWIHSKLCEL